MSNDATKEKSPMRMFVIGGLAGVIEVMIQQPMVTWKTALQVGFTLKNPLALWRGVGINAMSIGPITALQYFIDTSLANWYTQIRTAIGTRENTPVKLAVSAFGGGLSGFVVSPAEFLMIRQQVRGGSLKEQAVIVYRQHRLRGLMRGLTPTCMREAGWVCSFLGVAPYLQMKLQAEIVSLKDNDTAAGFVASVLAGTIAAVVTQPADTIKTKMQADAGIENPMKYINTVGTAKAIWRVGGVKEFYLGMIPRTLRVIGAVFILGSAGQYKSMKLLKSFLD